MTKPIIAIIGEYDSNKKTHPLLNQSLDWLKEKYNFEYEWVGTQKVEIEGENILKKYSGIWSASGTPFVSNIGVYSSIKYARENNIPHLGTCGGFQHTIIEYAKNVIGIENATSEEYDNGSNGLVINKLSCLIKGTEMEVLIDENSKTFNLVKSKIVKEEYFCNYGINHAFEELLQENNMVFSGKDANGEVRIIELSSNDYFISTLFVPHAKSTQEKIHPIIEEFIKISIKKLMN